VPFELVFKLSSYLLVLDGLFALWLTGLFDPLSFGILLALFIISWWGEHLRALASKRFWDSLAFLFLPFLLLDFLYLAESFVAGIVHLLVFLTLYKLFNCQRNKDYLDLYVISFFQLVAASALTVSPAFLLAFVTYMVLGTWTFILLHLRQEAEVTDPSSRHVLSGRASLVSLRFLFFSLLVSLSAFAFTVAFFLVMPRVGRAYLPLKWQLGTMVTGFSDRVELGAFGSIQTDPTIVMRVRFPDLDGKHASQLDLRWRGVAFDHFDGQAWFADATSMKRIVMRGQDGLFYVGRSEGTFPVLKQEVYLEPIGTEALFAAPKVLGIAVNSPSLLVDGSGSVVFPAPPSSRIRYFAFSRLERGPDEGLRAGMPSPLPDEMRWAYLQLPELSPRITALAHSLVEGAKTPFEKIKLVEAYLQRNYRYSLDLKRDYTTTPIEDFLFQQKQGNCEYFAASMAVLLRSVGVPARVVNGFQKGEWNEFGGYYAVRQKDAHSWVEAHIDGYGWASFDPSPRAIFEAASQAPSGVLWRYLDSLKMRWNRYVIDYNLGDQVRLALTFKKRSEAFRNQMASTVEALKLHIARFFGKIPFSLLLPILLATFALLIILRSRVRPGFLGSGLFRRQSLSRHRILFYERTLDLLAKRGFIKEAHLTPREFAKKIEAEAGEAFDSLTELFELYYRVRFGGRPLTLPEEFHVKLLLGELKKGSV